MSISITAAHITHRAGVKISFQAPRVTSPLKKIKLTEPETPKRTRKVSSTQGAKGVILFTSPTNKIRRTGPYQRKRRSNAAKKSPVKPNVFPPEEGLASEATSVNNFTLDDVPLDDSASPEWEVDGGLEQDLPFAGDEMLVDDGGTVDVDGFWDYADTVLADALTFNEICEDLFVVQSWNMKSRVGGVSHFTVHSSTSNALTYDQMRLYHLERSTIGDEVIITCYCPQGTNECLHIQFMKEYGQERFPAGAANLSQRMSITLMISDEAELSCIKDRILPYFSIANL